MSGNARSQSSTDNVAVVAKPVKAKRVFYVSIKTGARVGSMVNICECLINVVIADKLKTRNRLGQKWQVVGTRARCSLVMGNNTTGG